LCIESFKLYDVQTVDEANMLGHKTRLA
jgi:hypothetical protein